MITVDSNIKEAMKSLSKAQYQVIPKAVSSALNKTARTVMKEVRRDVAKDTGLKQKEVAERMTLVKSSKFTQSVTIRMEGRWFNLIRFNARQTKKGVKAKAWGKPKLYRGAFIGKGRNNNRLVFARTSKKRLPIKALVGPSPAVEFNKRIQGDEFRRRVIGRFEKVFNQELNYRLGKLHV